MRRGCGTVAAVRLRSRVSSRHGAGRAGAGTPGRPGRTGRDRGAQDAAGADAARVGRAAAAVGRLDRPLPLGRAAAGRRQDGPGAPVPGPDRPRRGASGGRHGRGRQRGLPAGGTGPGALDVARRSRTCADGPGSASLAGDDAAAEALLREASASWRGDPELPATAAGDAEADRLAEERRAARRGPPRGDARRRPGRRGGRHPGRPDRGTPAAGTGRGSCGSARSTWPAARPTPSTHTGRCAGTCATRWASSRVLAAGAAPRGPRADRARPGGCARPGPSRSWPRSPPTSRTTPRRAGSTSRTDGSAPDPRRCCS